MSQSLVVDIEQLSFAWPNRHNKSPNSAPWQLNIPHLELKKGQHLFILGSSGSGKSTLLNLLSGMLSPQSGTLKVCGQNLNTLSNAKKDRFRAQHLGLIFQQLNLIPYLS